MDDDIKQALAQLVLADERYSKILKQVGPPGDLQQLPEKVMNEWSSAAVARRNALAKAREVLKK